MHCGFQRLLFQSHFTLSAFYEFGSEWIFVYPLALGNAFACASAYHRLLPKLSDQLVFRVFV